tara:strand:+ start:6247 stop:6729 length:483 start_codon:yes stop_codon:yes gene_type:complete
MMNKKGTVVLRDVMFMIIIFGGVMALMSIAVFDMSSEYSNTNLTSDYNALGISTLGGVTSADLNKTVTSQISATLGENEGEQGTGEAIGISFDKIASAPKIVLGVFINAPRITSNALSIMFKDLGIPSVIFDIIATMILSILAIILVFGIITALLKGGKM